MAEPTYLWHQFVWPQDNGDVFEIDPFYIRAHGKTRTQNEGGKVSHIVWLDYGAPRVLTQSFENEVDAQAELDRIRNAKMRN